MKEENRKFLEEMGEGWQRLYEEARDPVLLCDFKGNIRSMNASCQSFFGHQNLQGEMENIFAYTVSQEQRVLLERYLQEATVRGMAKGQVTLASKRGRVSKADTAVYKISRKGVDIYQCLFWPSHEENFDDEIDQALYQIEKMVDNRTQLYLQANQQISREIVGRKEAEKARNQGYFHLFQAEKMAIVGQMTANLLQEIHPPISALSKTFQSLYHYSIDRQQHSKIADHLSEILLECQEEISKIHDILKNLQSFIKSDARQMQEVDLLERIESAIRLVSGQLGERCKIRQEIKKLPPIKGYPNQILQVLFNLIKHALQAIHGAGCITLSASYLKPYVEITVTNDGPGISCEEQQKIFEPVFVERSEDNPLLGLWISREIVQRHGGTLEMASEEGEGTSFILKFPLNP